MAYLTTLVILLAASALLVTATEEECKRCYTELTDCTKPCTGDSWTLPPTCNDVECRKIFDSCWMIHCVVKNEDGNGEGGQAGTNGSDTEKFDTTNDDVEETDDGSVDIEDSNTDGGEGEESNSENGDDEEVNDGSGDSEDSEDKVIDLAYWLRG